VNDIFLEDVADASIERRNVNMVVICWLPFGAKLPQRPALHQVTTSAPP
jgi:hypothetical protein